MSLPMSLVTLCPSCGQPTGLCASDPRAMSAAVAIATAAPGTPLAYAFDAGVCHMAVMNAQADLALHLATQIPGGAAAALQRAGLTAAHAHTGNVIHR